MTYSYDPEADAMYITLSKVKKGSNVHTEEVSSDLLLDYSEKKLIGIELLNVSSKLSKDTLRKKRSSVFVPGA